MRRYLKEMAAFYDAFEEVNEDSGIFFSQCPSEADNPIAWDDVPTAFLLGIETDGPECVLNNIVCAEFDDEHVFIMLFRGVDSLPGMTEDADWEIQVAVTSKDGRDELETAMKELLNNLRD